MSDSVRPHRRQPIRLPRPWDSPGKNTGVGCHFLLQCMKVKSESEVAQLCSTLSNPMDCSPPGSPVPGIFQARVLEWGAIVFSRLHHRWYLIRSVSVSVHINTHAHTHTYTQPPLIPIYSTQYPQITATIYCFSPPPLPGPFFDHPKQCFNRHLHSLFHLILVRFL